MKKRRLLPIWFGVLFGLSLFPLESTSADSAASLLAIKATLTELQAVIDRTQIGLDSIAASKIEAASNEAQRLLREIEKIQKGIVRDANESIQEVAKQTHQLASSLRKALAETERRAFLDVNTALAHVSQTLDGIPLTKVDPYSAAIEPPRIRADATNRRVSIYGYFPDVKDGRIPTVILRDKSIPLTKESGAKLSFDLPMDINLKEEEFLSIEISVPTRTGWFDLWKSDLKFSDRIYVERSKPFSCDLEIFEANPALDEVVNATNEFTDDARTMGGGGKPSNIRTVSAKDLLIATVPGSVDTYDLSTARINSPGERFWGDAACSDHGNWSGKIRRWDPDSIEFELSAPSVSPHMHTRMREDCGFVSNVLGEIAGKRCIMVPDGYLHGGGGSHANIALKPTFIVRKKGVDPLVKKTQVSFPLGLQSTVKRDVTFLQKEWQLNLLCSYKDGDEKWDTGPIILSPQLHKAVNKGVAASFENGSLFVGAQ